MRGMILAAVVVALALVGGPARADQAEVVREAVQKAIAGASLVKEVLKLEVHDSAYSPSGVFLHPKKNRNGEQEKNASGQLLYETLAKDGKVTVTTTAPALMVRVNFLASSSWSDRLTKRGIQNAMMDGYHAAFTAGPPIFKATMSVFMTFVDRLGNDTRGIVYGTTAFPETFAGMNWERRKIVDPDRIWKVWRRHPAFR